MAYHSLEQKKEMQAPIIIMHGRGADKSLVAE